MRILPAGDQALTVELSDQVDDEVNRQVIALADALESDPIAGVTETVPTYRSLLVLYDPGIIRGAALTEMLAERLTMLGTRHLASRRWTVPVHYGGPAALDLAELAKIKGMDVETLVSIHSAAEYRVHMIGFAPGFTYLGGLPEPLHTPRLTTPRQHVAAGSIGIGGKQACINSVDGPSGWRYIGRTPLKLFDPAAPEPVLFKAGDLLRFTPVSAEEMEDLEARAAAGETIAKPEHP